MKLILIAVVIIVAVAGLYIWSRSNYYGRIFSESHYREIFDWICQVIRKDQVTAPSLEDSTVFQSSGGLALVMTKEHKKGKWVYHFSVSEIRGFTTQAVGGRVLFLILTTRNENKAEADLFFSQSSVGHLIFITEAPSLEVTEFKIVMNALRQYKPLQIRTEEVPGT